jgi:hypothetical protein
MLKYSFAKNASGEIDLHDPELKVVFDLAMATDEELYATPEARRLAETALRTAAERLAFDSKRDFETALKEIFAREPQLAWASRLRVSPTGTIRVHGQ